MSVTLTVKSRLNPIPSDGQRMEVDLPAHVQQEIDDLYYFVPEVSNHFTIVDKIGEGTFSSVFLAELKHYPDVKEMFALKHIIPTSHPRRILGELTCLKLLGGSENVMGLELCLRNKDHIVIVMRYFPHQKFQDYFNTFKICDVRDYMKNLLIALRHVHKLDIIHRDIKPSNFLHNTENKQYALVDFGLAHDAPLKLHVVNKGRPPLVKAHQMQSPEKENVSLSLQKINREGDVTPGLLPPPPPVGNHGNKSSKPEQILMSTNHASHPPGRSILECNLVNGDDVHKRKEDKSHSKRNAAPSKHSRHPINSATCNCYGCAVVCSICSVRSIQSAQRAGTPGFRAPEVLMKHPQQSTAVDIWSAGVIFLSLLSGRYPFFRGNDDLTCLSQIISLLGTECLHKAAHSFGKLLTCRPVVPPVDLKSLCQRLRASPETSNNKHASRPTEHWAEIPESAIDLLKRLLDPNPATRITAHDAISHKFFAQN